MSTGLHAEDSGFTAEYCGVGIKRLQTKEEARRVVDFFFSEISFDDNVFTPGEIKQLKTHPFLSLKVHNFQYWYAVNEKNEVIAAGGVRENEQKNGGYVGDYLAVHKLYRHLGIASRMMDIQEEYVQSEGGKYLLIATGDTPLYKSIRHLLKKRGYTFSGHLTDYYFKGEGLVYYIKKINDVL